jgi:hypothetical protein
MDIKIFGSDCKCSQKFEQLVREVCTENNINANIEFTSDFAELLKNNIISTPALVVNGKLLSSGKTPLKSTLKHWLLDENTICKK